MLKLPTPVARAGDTVEKVADILKSQILQGRLAPGQRLISKDISEELGISRGPLREAFRRLAADRLVDLIPNRGAVVRRLTPDEIVHLFQIREALEGQAARLAAQNISQANNKAMFQAVADEGEHLLGKREMQPFVEHNRRFHQAVVSISGNTELAELIDRYQLAVFMPLLHSSVGTDKLIEDSLTQHAQIAHAILAGDPDQAYVAMKNHLWHSANGMLARAKAQRSRLTA